MATHTGSEGLIKIANDTLGELRSYSLETTGDTIEDTSMGDSARTYKAGLTAWSGTASLYFDEADTAQPGNDIFYSSDVSKTPESVKNKYVKKYEEKLMVWLAIS